eukprot:5000887-Pyramimonas_sp.AAC.3
MMNRLLETAMAVDPLLGSYRTDVRKTLPCPLTKCSGEVNSTSKNDPKIKMALVFPSIRLWGQGMQEGVNVFWVVTVTWC